MSIAQDGNSALVAASRRDPAAIALVSAYFELVFDDGTTSEGRDLAIEAGLLADVERLVAVGRSVRDPMPWRPFLRHLHAIPSRVRTQRAADALARLDGVAREMLRQQGLELVHPEDVLGHASPLAETIVSLLTQD